MAVTLRKLLECVEEEKIHILAGQNNLDRAVRWTHMVESIEISTFLEGQEIAFTTGAALKSEEGNGNHCKHRALYQRSAEAHHIIL